MFLLPDWYQKSDQKLVKWSRVRSTDQKRNKHIWLSLSCVGVVTIEWEGETYSGTKKRIRMSGKQTGNTKKGGRNE